MLRGYTPDGQGTGGYSVSGGVALSTLVTGLVAYWSLDETSGTRADSVGSADLTDNNTVGYDTGVNGNAASFVAGNLEKLSCASTSLPAGTHSFTLSAWFNPTGVSGEFAIVGRFHTALPSRDYLLDLVNDQIWFFSASGSNPRWTTPAIQAGVWHHVLGWYDSATGNASIAVNNGTPVTNAITPETGEAAFVIGSYDSPGAPFTGLIDEVGIWSRVLTEDERAELYNSGTGKFYNGTNFV